MSTVRSGWGMPSLTFTEALRHALRDEMIADPAVVLWGEDIGRFGGAYGVTKGLYAEFGPLRVRDTPISEAAMVSFGVGAAMAGLRPVVEVMFTAVLTLATEVLLNQAAKTRYRTGGQWYAPLTVRARCGARPGAGPVTGESYVNVFSGVPGLVVMAPGTPDGAYRLLRAAIRSDDPVVFLEHGALYNTRGEVAAEDGGYTGQARVLRSGRDVTLVALTAMVPQALAAAEQLVAEGIDVEVIDPSTIFPCDMETISGSAKRTGRLVIAQDWPLFGGIAAEIAAQVHAVADLRVPAVRIGPPMIPFPSAVHFGRSVLPTAGSIADGVRSVMLMAG